MSKHNNQKFNYKQNVNIILKQLRDDIEMIFNKGIVEYIDIVSVDLLNQSENVSYDVYFFGPEINDRYVKFINDYFDISKKSNKSLLNIKTSGEKVFSGVNLQRTIKQTDNKIDHKYWLKNFDLYSTALTFVRDKEELDEDIDIHFEKWTESLKPHYPNLKHVFFHKRAIDIVNNEIAVAAIWIGLNKAIKDDTNIRVIETKIQNTLSNHIISSLIPEYLSVIDKQAIKSAIAAIMSRNMSHNLGSHILSYLKNSLSEIPKVWDNNLAEMQKLDDDKTGYDFVLKLNEKLKDKINIIYGNKEDGEAPFLLGLGHFLNYLQERQDFIATIASDFLPYFGTVNFKDFIYDELNRDLKIIRHKKEDNSRYRMKNLLLEYIAYSEDFNRDKIKIHFGNFDGLNNHKDLEKLRKINCDLPGGIIGRQAFFSIFENIIRNAAKHGGKKESELQFTILIEDFEEYNEFWKISIVDNNANANNAIVNLRQALVEKYVDESGKIIETNKGIKEIRISAAWLRSENVANINEQNMPNGQPAILSIDRAVVGKSDDKNAEPTDKKWIFVTDEYNKAGNLIIDETQNTNLAYTFYLRKTQKAVFITNGKISDIFNFDQVKTDPKNIKKELNNEFEIKTLEEYKKEANKNFDIIFTDEKFGEKEFDKIKLISTSRCFPPISAQELKLEFKEAKEKVGKNDFIDKVIYGYFYKWIKVSYEKDIAEINTDDQQPYIAIIDKLVNDKNKNKIHPPDTKRMKIFANDTEFFDSIKKSKNQIIFRTHNDSENEFNLLRWTDNTHTKEREEFTNAKFIEGISGHNSSERLIRSVKFSEEWALKITESALTSVLVLDERIFQRLNGESDKLFYKTINVEQHIEKIETIINTNKTETEKADILQTYIVDKIGLKIDDEIKRIIAFVVDEDFPEDISNLTNILVSKGGKIDIKKENFEKVVYNKKNIHVFSLLEDDKEFIIVDINSKKIGTLLWQNNKLVIERTDYGKNEANFRLKYDFVVTHQGLLDKLYGNMFRQSSGYENIKKNDFKEDLYENFRNIFVAKHKQIIHSGRSKPEMLPRDTVFNQYSSVESALFDCKFSLTELLYSARPEKETWNK